jgi:hypothetical protein
MLGEEGLDEGFKGSRWRLFRDPPCGRTKGDRANEREGERRERQSRSQRRNYSSLALSAPRRDRSPRIWTIRLGRLEIARRLLYSLRQRPSMMRTPVILITFDGLPLTSPRS